MDNLKKLVSIGSPPLLDRITMMENYTALPWLEKIADLLMLKNGFYAFESGLHVFPFGKLEGVMDLEQWNSNDLWRYEYKGLTDNLLFFAEDAFGYQFCASKDGISMFNPEFASLEHIADDIEGWAKAVLDDYDERAAYPFVRDWQKVNGPLRVGRRLTFKIPLVAGGTTEMSNVGDSDAVEVMRFRGYLWDQIKDLPPGTKFEFEIVD